MLTDKYKAAQKSLNTVDDGLLSKNTPRGDSMQNRVDSMGIKFFRSLPPEILVQIGSHLNQDDKKSLKIVSSEFHGQIEKYNSLYVRHHYDVEAVKDVFRKITDLMRDIMHTYPYGPRVLIVAMVAPPSYLVGSLMSPVIFFAGKAKEATEKKRHTNEIEATNAKIRKFTGNQIQFE